MAARLYIAGTGSYAAEIASWATAAGMPPAGLIELIDDSRIGSTIHRLPVVGVAEPSADAVALLGLGGDRAEGWAPLAEAGWSAAPALVHPDASVAEAATLGIGVMIGPGAVVGTETAVGPHAVVSRGALVGHHVAVGEFVTIAPGANVGGNSAVGPSAFLGLGCVVSNGIAVGRAAVIAAGAVVVRDVAEGIRVQGVPAREYP